MKKLAFFISIFISLLFHSGCNKQSRALDYEDLIFIEEIDGNSRDLLFNNDTLYVVSEVDGLLIYKINEDSEGSSISLESLYSDSLEFQNNGWNLNEIQYSNPLKSIITLDKFYSIYFLPIYQVPNLIQELNVQFQKLCCNSGKHHPSTFTINQQNNMEIFSLVRHKSNQVGIPTDIVSIYKVEINECYYSFLCPEVPEQIIDSLIYDATDIYYINNNLFISHTSYDHSEFRIYSRNNTDSPFGLEKKISTPFKPVTLYSNENYLFVGMADHGGVKIYNIDSMEEISWISQGFSVRDIYWDPGSKFLLLSCGYQGVVVFELDNDMNIDNTWVLSTSYAYTARDYNDHVLISTRNGIEIIKIK